MALMTTGFLDVPGGRLAYVDEGAGPPIVLLHAGIANLRSWDAIVPFLVAPGYRVVRYDLRGFGETVTDAVSFSNRADVIALLDALGIGRAALVGNSLGGVVAFDTAVEFPERFVAVIGVAAGLGGYESTVASPEEIATYEALDALEFAEPQDVPAIADGMVRFWVDGLGQSPDRVPSAIREAIREQQTDILRPDRINGEPIPLDPRAEARLSALTMPILAVAGMLDGSEMTDTARHLEATAPNARAVIWDDVAHMIGMEQPERLATLIDEFLAPLPRWS
jgi:pimeloyl-ACP methyl ester carboxylesterase